MFKKFLKLTFYTCVCMFIGMCVYLYFTGSVTVAAVPGENKITMENAGGVYPGYAYVDGVRYTYLTNGTYFQIVKP